MSFPFYLRMTRFQAWRTINLGLYSSMMYLLQTGGSLRLCSLAMGKIFPEADPSCYRDVSKLYFGGKGVLYRDDELPEINVESLFRNYRYYLIKRYKDKHYKEQLRRFSKETGIALTENGFLDIKVTDHLPETDDPTEDRGVSLYYKNGENSPTAIIYDQNISNIKEDGEIPPKQYYIINFDSENTRSFSVKTPGGKNKNHKFYRSGVLEEMDGKCKLFHEFASGKRKLGHNELFGIATNLIQIESRYKIFHGDKIRISRVVYG